MALNYLLFLVTHSAQSFYTRAIMSQPLASTPAVNPVTTQTEFQQAVNAPTSTSQTDAQLPQLPKPNHQFPSRLRAADSNS
jgi:hypothetical protein